MLLSNQGVYRKQQANMDRADWLVRVNEEGWGEWKTYMNAMDADGKGQWTVWALNLLCRLCEECACAGHPENLPRDASVLRSAVDSLLAGKSAQLQCRALRSIRKMVLADERCTPLLPLLPRHRRTERVNRITRQRRMVLDDALPKRGLQPWVRELFREILEHDASSHWRTSKTANQNFNMMHKFLRCSGLLDCTSLAEFHQRRAALSAEDITAMCTTFTDRFCATPSSAARYVVVFNHVFHRVWKMITENVRATYKRRRVRTLSELDEQLSASTRSTTSARDRLRPGAHRDYFDDAELGRIRSASMEGPHSIRDVLIVTLLETTGIRRMGVLNVLLQEIAEQNEENGPSSWL